jgi:hypothetical protein
MVDGFASTPPIKQTIAHQTRMVPLGVATLEPAQRQCGFPAALLPLGAVACLFGAAFRSRLDQIIDLEQGWGRLSCGRLAAEFIIRGRGKIDEPTPVDKSFSHQGARSRISSLSKCFQSAASSQTFSRTYILRFGTAKVLSRIRRRWGNEFSSRPSAPTERGHLSWDQNVLSLRFLLFSCESKSCPLYSALS